MLFTSVPVVRRRYRPDEPLPPGSDGFRRDRITLGWEERLRARARRVSDAGLEFATAVPRGTVLAGGDRLVLEEERTVVEVVERREPVLIVRPGTPGQWALYAYHIGNSHQPMMLCDDAIVCAAVPGMEEVLGYHRIPFERDERPFTPIGPSSPHRHPAGA